MKKLLGVTLVIAMFVSSVALAAVNFTGTYNFSGRFTNGTADMNDWNGTMSATGTELLRSYSKKDGSESKFYKCTYTPNGESYKFVITDSNKKENIGKEYVNKITLTGNTLTIESLDGKFKEVWTK